MKALIRRNYQIFLGSGSILIASLPYVFLSFLNVDPLHDGWFSSPGVRIAEGGLPYRDVVTSYGWVSPAILAVVTKIFGFHLLSSRIIGLLLLFGISWLLFSVLRRILSFRVASLLLSMWLLINLGQVSRDRDSLVSWGFWPNQLLVLISLLGIFYITSGKALSNSKVLLIGTLAGISPWIRAQGILILLALILVFLVNLDRSKGPSNRGKKILLIGSSTITFILPLIFVIVSGSFDYFIWQTIEMPRTGEWVGMPKLLPWILQNIGLAFVFALSAAVFGCLLSRFKFPIRFAGLLMAPILYLIWKNPIEIGPRSDHLVVRKLQSIANLYSNFYFFTYPVLVLLAVFLVYSLYSFTVIARNYRHINDNLALQVFCLSAPAVTLIYYNFGHIWGVTPLILTALAYSHREFLPGFVPSVPTIRFLFIYALIVSIFAAPQIYGKVMQQSFSYRSPGLEFMRGHDATQVRQVREAFQTISRIPRNQKAFFLCEYALYSIPGGHFLSDNIFYSTSMTKFQNRPEIYRFPKTKTKYLIYCPGAYTLRVDALPGFWSVASFSPDSDRTSFVVYQRG